MWIYSCLFRGVRNNSIYRELKNRLSLRLFDQKKRGIDKAKQKQNKRNNWEKIENENDYMYTTQFGNKNNREKRDKKKIGRRGKKEEKYFTH